MSSCFVLIIMIMLVHFLLLLSSSFHVNVFPAGKVRISGVVALAEATRPVHKVVMSKQYSSDHDHQDNSKYVSFNNINGPKNIIHDAHHDQRPQQRGNSKGFENCLPKGFHRTSAPSRYINYQPLVSEMCSTIKPPPPPPLPLPDRQ